MILETKGPMGLLTLLVAMPLPLLADAHLLAVFSAFFTFHDHPMINPKGVVRVLWPHLTAVSSQVFAAVDRSYLTLKSLTTS